MRLFVFLPALFFGLVLAAACVEQQKVTTQDVVATIPWRDQERAQYALLDRDGTQERGQGTLSIARQGAQFELKLSFQSGKDTDDTVVLVDAASLKPSSVRRERHISGDATIVDGKYDATEKTIRTTVTSGGKERTIPRRLSDEHYFDNESSLFVWRTITFQDKYKASYYTVLTNQGGTQQLVSLEVTGKEQVTVPAGTFQAWRLEIRTSDLHQTAWYADTPERPLVQYDNSRQLFQLTALQ